MTTFVKSVDSKTFLAHISGSSDALANPGSFRKDFWAVVLLPCPFTADPVSSAVGRTTAMLE